MTRAPLSSQKVGLSVLLIYICRICLVKDDARRLPTSIQLNGKYRRQGHQAALFGCSSHHITYLDAKSLYATAQSLLHGAGAYCGCLPRSLLVFSSCLYMNQEVNLRWSAARRIRQWYKAHRWRFSVPVITAVHIYRGTTVRVWRAMIPFNVWKTASTVALVSDFQEDSTWLQWTTLHTSHVTCISTLYNWLTLASISVLKVELVLQISWNQQALNSSFSVNILAEL